MLKLALLGHDPEQLCAIRQFSLCVRETVKVPGIRAYHSVPLGSTPLLSRKELAH